MRVLDLADDEVPGATIGGAIRAYADRRPGSLALVGPGEEGLSFGDLAARLDVFGQALAAFGVEAGSRLGVLIPHTVDAAVISVAAAAYGTHVPLNPHLTAPELEAVISRLRLRAIVADAQTADLAAAVAGARDLDVFQIAPGLAGAEPLARLRQGRRFEPEPTDDGVALIMRSSGTMGAPKYIPVTHQNLIAMAGKMARWLGLSADDRSACTLPLHFAAGLKQSLYAPLLLGGGVAIPSAAERDRFDTWATRLKPTWLTSSPASLQGMVDAMRGSGAQRVDGFIRFVLCGSAVMPERLRAEAEALLGVPVLAAYGLSETGLIATQRPPPTPNVPGTVGVAPPGELTVLGPNGKAVPSGTDGEVAATGPSVMPGYLAEDGRIEPRSGWFMTGDIGRLDADGNLTIVGRSKEMINRGGEKISPYEVEAALLAHPDILEAAAFPIPHPRLGEVVSAAVVLRPGAKLEPEQYRAFLARRLARAKLPNPIAAIPTLPRNGAGKIMRSELAAAATVAERPPTAPDGLLELQIHAVWARMLGRDEIGVEEDFFAAGGDSLLATQMMLALEARTGRPVPAIDSDRPITIRELAARILQEPADQLPVVMSPSQANGPSFFFCHGDFLTTGFYARHLADLTAGCCRMHLVNPPKETVAHARTPLPVLARDYVPRLMELQPTGPFILGGFCNGGQLAWELARQLIAQGREVRAIVLVDVLSLNLRPEMRLARRLAVALSMLAAPFGARPAVEGFLMLLAWKTRRGELAGALARRLLYRAGLRAEKPVSQTQLDRHAFYAVGGYRPRRLPVPVYAINCEVSMTRPEFDPRQWGKVAASLKRWVIPGTHYTCLTVHVDRLADAVGSIFTQLPPLA